MAWKRWLTRYGLGVWGLVTFSLALMLFLEFQKNGMLQEKVQLLERLDALTAEKCEGVHRVNAVCEEALLDIGMRLGLDNDMMPLVTTALWKRATHGERISHARERLGAKRVGAGLLERSRVEGEAIGGPGPEDEGEGQCPKKKRAKTR